MLLTTLLLKDYEITPLANGVVKITLPAVDDVNDWLELYLDDDGILSDDGYMLDELVSRGLVISDLRDDVAKIALRFGCELIDDELQANTMMRGNALVAMIQTMTTVFARYCNL